MILFYMKPL